MNDSSATTPVAPSQQGLFCDLGEQGQATEPARYQMLTEHRRFVEELVSALHTALELLDHKLGFYPQHTKQ